MQEQFTIAYLIRQLLTKVFKIVAVMVVVFMFSLYLFTSYTAVVNEAGIVRGGSQRVIKLVLAGSDASKATEKVEGLIKKLDGAILLGGFSSSRDKVENYWNTSIKPAISEYNSTKDPSKLLSLSEEYFNLTNEMVDKAQTMVDIMAYLLYVVLIAFAVVVGLFLKRVQATFEERVVDPIAALEGSINKLSQGHLSQKI